MYILVTRGDGWYKGLEGHVFKVNATVGSFHYVDGEEAWEVGGRRYVEKGECVEIEIPRYIDVNNETGLLEYAGHGYKLVEQAAKEGDLVLITKFDDEVTGVIREVRRLSGSSEGDFYLDQEIGEEDYVDTDPGFDEFYVMIPVKNLLLEEEPVADGEFRPNPGATPEPEMVEHPSHYTAGKFETIEIIEEVTKGYENSFVGYAVGNTQKYIARAPYKGKQLEDLKKARKYLDFAIQHLEVLGDE